MGYPGVLLRSCFRVLLVIGAVCWSVGALGYCRQRSCNDDVPGSPTCERDATGCVTEGHELSYADNCINFAVAHASGAVIDLDDAEFEALVRGAFDAWANVDCGGGEHPGFIAQSAGVVPAEGPEYCPVLGTVNTNVFFFVQNWMLDFATLGYTHSTFQPNTGIILDADVELNADYVVSAPSVDRRVLMSAVIKHETGHLLGLAHSNNPNAVMAATYDPATALLPDFTQDDVDAICAAFAPSRRPTACRSPRVDSAGISPAACAAKSQPEQSEAGCALRPKRSAEDWGHGWVVPLIALMARRRRPRY